MSGFPPPAIAIGATGLTKDFGDGRGVFDLDLSVRAGEIFGFIGPNGAGKTTTIRLLMDLLRPDRGRASILGHDTRDESLLVKRIVGYLPGELPQFGGLRGAEIIGLLASLRGGVDQTRIGALAKRFDLDLHLRYRELSHGNKQKIALVQAFMHEPTVLILDEPTLGLDPLLQHEFRTLLAESVARGATVFLSSHVLSEIEQVCDRIAFITGGRVTRTGSLAELRALRVHHVEMRVSRPADRAALLRVPGVSDVVIEDGLIRCAVHGSFEPLMATVRANGIEELDSRELSLEELFLAEYGDGPRS
jgi:ABC-2 type transport system ATP-binding protein